jgi:hypothetical protein
MWKALLIPLIPIFIYQVKMLIEEYNEDRKEKKRDRRRDSK